MTEEYDVTQPILILVRRGRGERGYLVAAVDDASNPFPCPDAAEVGNAVVELLNDPAQPRFDEKQLEAAASDSEDDGEYEDEDDDDLEDDSEDEDEYEDEDDEGDGAPQGDPLDDLGLDPGEKLLFKVGEALLGKARHVSNDYRDKRKKRKKKTKKKKRTRR
jgi:hypothetical protein